VLSGLLVGSDYVSIKTIEGFVKRANISKLIDVESMVVEIDEKYIEGSKD
jgi:hypothetical protein